MQGACRWAPRRTSFTDPTVDPLPPPLPRTDASARGRHRCFESGARSHRHPPAEELPLPRQRLRPDHPNVHCLHPPHDGLPRLLDSRPLRQPRRPDDRAQGGVIRAARRQFRIEAVLRCPLGCVLFSLLAAMDEGTQLSSPFSTGAGGANFENGIQTAFVVLMLTGGFAPCLPAFPITKVKLQGRYAGFQTDDCIVFVQERAGERRAKLLAQIKHSLSFTERDETFAEVIQAAWLDFNNAELFDRRTDMIAVVTGPLAATDIENVRTILEWARHSETAQDFVTKVELAQFSSAGKRAKLQAFRAQLREANKGVDVSNEQLWQFLKSFHVLGYDLDVASGVTLSLLKSHIGQFAADDASDLWASVAKEVGSFNQSAGTITIETLSEELRSAFTRRAQPEMIPTEFLKAAHQQPPSSAGHALPAEYENAIAFASIIGAWNDKVQGDAEVIRKLITGT